ncbi:hypothetical protein [Streptomyces sp. NPDC018045]|uniref:hypothetical protein n=1 Tax=Streptomyces sp. NPDC018045 TaxID=3365037 RepID=UPI0037B25880
MRQQKEKMECSEKEKARKNSAASQHDQTQRSGTSTSKRRKRKYDTWPDAEKAAVMTSGIHTS